MNKKKIIILISIVLAIILVGMGIKNVLNSNDNTVSTGINGPNDGLLVQVGTVGVEDIISDVTADGQVDMINENTVFSPNTAKIQSLNFQVGDTVKKGDILLTFDPSSLEDLKEELEIAKLDLKSGQLAMDSITIPASKEQTLQLESQLMANENSIEMANKQLEQIDLQMANNVKLLTQAQDKYKTGQILYGDGIISKDELDELENNVSNIQNTIKATELERENAINSISTANKSYEDTKIQMDLLKNKNSSDAVVNQIQTQKIILEKLNLRINELENQINNFEETVISPYDGIILINNVEIGTTVQDGTPLFTIGNTTNDNLIVRVNVLEYDSGGVKLGQDAVITGDALGNNEVYGTVTKIYPTIEEKIINGKQKKVVQVEIKANDTDLIIRPGSTVEATITTDIDEDQTVVPLMSIMTDDNGEDYCMIVDKEFKAEKRPVNIGVYTGSNVSVDNVEPDETVIIEPPSTLKNGDLVKYSSPVEE